MTKILRRDLSIPYNFYDIFGRNKITTFSKMWGKEYLPLIHPSGSATEVHRLLDLSHVHISCVNHFFNSLSYMFDLGSQFLHAAFYSVFKWTCAKTSGLKRVARKVFKMR